MSYLTSQRRRQRRQRVRAVAFRAYQRKIRRIDEHIARILGAA